ncbi:MAG: HD domain-containing protein [Bacteroidales bacterium]
MGKESSTNKLKIINDPVYGFIKIPFPEIFDLVQDPRFQRLRRIRQGGLTHLVYPGANHTRFQHALGAMHLMGQAIEVIRSKGHPITDEEALAVTMAILLHDMGHGPFSHSLEYSLVKGIEHEEISLMFMEAFNREWQGGLDMTLAIFRDLYPKKFLHQLVSSQLDMDRLDYLKRDSYFTGVTEGVVGSDRIIKMLNVLDDNLVVDEKGIYSIEKFLVARRLMYWQVYLHKTVLSAEQLLVQTLSRARVLRRSGEPLFATPALDWFLLRPPDRPVAEDGDVFLEKFALLDDADILVSAKVWCDHPDTILRYLSRGLVHRNLFSVELRKAPFPKEQIDSLRRKAAEAFSIPLNDTEFLVVSDSISNNAYSEADDRIAIQDKHGRIRDITEASDMLNMEVLSKTVRKYFLCYPKNLASPTGK